MSGRNPGYDSDATPRVFVYCSECGRRVDRTNVLMVENADGTYCCWNAASCARAQGEPDAELADAEHNLRHSGGEQ